MSTGSPAACALGGGDGRTVAIMLVNRPQLLLVDMATQVAGGTPVSIYATSPVKCFVIVPEVWNADSGLVTPTLKLKRRAATERYAAQIDALYDT